MEINFYKDLSNGRDKLVFERVNKQFFDSETLWNELVWCKELQGRGDESGVFAPISVKALKDIVDEYALSIEKEIGKEEMKDLYRVIFETGIDNVLMCKIDN